MAIEMMSAPGTTDRKPPGVDCRVYARQACELPAMCQPAPGCEAKELRWLATIADISQGGVCIHLQRRFEPGTPLAIELPGEVPNETSVAFVKVVHVRAGSAGQWALACRFISHLDEDQIVHLIGRQRLVLPLPINAPCEPGPAPAAKRMLDEVVLEIATSAAPRYCFFKRLDVSNSWPLTAGATLRIRGTVKDGTVRAFQIEILSASQVEGQWRLRGRVANTRDRGN